MHFRDVMYAYALSNFLIALLNITYYDIDKHRCHQYLILVITEFRLASLNFIFVGYAMDCQNDKNYVHKT